MPPKTSQTRRSTGGGRLPAVQASKNLAPPPDFDLHPVQNAQLRRRIRNPALPATAAGSARRRKGFSVAGGRRSGPNTPLLRWKFNEKTRPTSARSADGMPAAPPRVLARKLAAGIWHFGPTNVGSSGSGDCGGGLWDWRARQGMKPIPQHLEVHLLHDSLAVDIHSCSNKKNERASPVSVLSPKSGEFQKVKQFAGFPSCAMEKATKWDQESSTALDEVYRLYSHLNFDDQEAKTVCVVSSLRSELEQAHGRIAELENEKRSTKKKLDQFFKRLTQEKTMWRSREHEKVRGIIDGIKDEVNKERKKRHRMELINSKLVNELAEAKLSAKHFMQDCEKERKARVLIEEVCDELAKEIGEDKAAIEALKMEALRIREEVEEEKRMLQMAEVWREERVQMKLIDAKLTLEEKYSELAKLKAELEVFLGSSTNLNSDVASKRKAELLKSKTETLNIEELKEFVYQPPPASEDIYAIFEELQPGEAVERDIEPCTADGPTSHPSEIHMASPETDVFLHQSRKEHVNELIDSNNDIEDDSDWETVSQTEEQGSCNSPDGTDPSVNNRYHKGNVSGSVEEWENNGNNKLETENFEISRVSTKQSGKRVPAFYRLWRSSAQDNVEYLKRTSIEVKNNRLSNGRQSDGTYTLINGEEQRKVSVEIANGRMSHTRNSNASISTEMGCGGVGSTPETIGHWSSPESLNHHGARGLRGCIEWPRGNQKHNLKAKLLEARIESQKVQLRHVLKQKT